MITKINADVLNKYLHETGKQPFPANHDPLNVTYTKHFVKWLLDEVLEFRKNEERRILIEYEDWMNNYPKKEDQIKAVDIYLSRFDR